MGFFEEQKENIEQEDLYSIDANDGYQKQVLEKWFNESERSPLKFKKNSITSTDVRDMSSMLFYEPMVNMNTSGEVLSVDDLSVCSAAIKSCPYYIVHILPNHANPEDIEKIESYSAENPDTLFRIPETLFIYGNVYDVDDEFGSRLDSDMCYKLEELVTKFNNVMLSGAFKNVDDMVSVFRFVSEKVLKKDPFSRIKIDLSSRVRDDDGNIKTVAALINSGYIDRNIIPEKSIVEYVFKKTNRKLAAQLFMKELQKYSGGKLL